MCPQATGHSFDLGTQLFWRSTPWEWEKHVFSLRPFSSIFFFILCNSSVPCYNVILRNEEDQWRNWTLYILKLIHSLETGVGNCTWNYAVSGKLRPMKIRNSTNRKLRYVIFWNKRAGNLCKKSTKGPWNYAAGYRREITFRKSIFAIHTSFYLYDTIL